MKTKFKPIPLTLGLAAILPLITSAQVTTAPKSNGTVVNMPVPEAGSSGQRPPTPGFNGVIKLDVHDSKNDWTPYTPKKAPEGAPNFLFILYDDTGCLRGRLMPVASICRRWISWLRTVSHTHNGTPPRFARQRVQPFSLGAIIT